MTEKFMSDCGIIDYEEEERKAYLISLQRPVPLYSPSQGVWLSFGISLALFVVAGLVFLFMKD